MVDQVQMNTYNEWCFLKGRNPNGEWINMTRHKLIPLSWCLRVFPCWDKLCFGKIFAVTFWYSLPICLCHPFFSKDSLTFGLCEPNNVTSSSDIFFVLAHPHIYAEMSSMPWREMANSTSVSLKKHLTLISADKGIMAIMEHFEKKSGTIIYIQYRKVCTSITLSTLST